MNDMLTCLECNRRVISTHQRCPFCGGELIKRLSHDEQTNAANTYHALRNQLFSYREDESPPLNVATFALRALIVLIGSVFLLVFFGRLSLDTVADAGLEGFIAVFAYIGVVIVLPLLFLMWLMTRCKKVWQHIVILLVEIVIISRLIVFVE